MLRRYVNKRTVRVFAALFCSIVLLAGSIASAVFLHERERIGAEYREKLELDIDRVMNLYSHQLKTAYNSCINIFNSRWFRHYRAINGYYRNEFDALKRIEIMDELSRLAESLACVEDVLVISPSLHTVISRHGWLSDSFYETAFGLVRIESREGDWPVVRAGHPDYSICTVHDPNMRYEKSVITLVLRNREFLSSYRSTKIGEAIYLKAILGDCTLAQTGEVPSNVILLERSQQVPSFSLQIGYQSVQSAVYARMNTTVLLVFLVILLSSLILSFLIAVLVTKPMTDLVASVGGDRNAMNDPERFLSAYLEAYSDQKNRLQAENEGMQSAHTRFLHLIEKEILYGLLNNVELSPDSPSLQVIFPWTREGLVLILAVMIPKYGSDPMSERNDFARFSALADVFRHIVIREEDVLFFWTERQHLQKTLEGIKRELDGSYCLYSLSEPLSSLREIREGYLQCSRELEAQKIDWLSIPMNLETRMQAALQSGKIENCLSILAEARERSNPDAFLQLFTRAAMEYEMPLDGLLKLYHMAAVRGENNQQWALLTECAEQLCQVILMEKQRGSRLQISAVCSYIDKNFTDPSLGAEQAAEHFAMHPTLLSKQFKAYTGQTFSAYLQDLRLSAARQMLIGTQKSIVEIAGDVGYASYQTFLRAFKRCYGVSPKDLREEMSDPDSRPERK